MTPAEAESAVRNRPLPEVEALIERLKLPSALMTYGRGMNHMLDRGFLCFGRAYKVKETIAANRHGVLSKNDEVRFLGASVFPYDNGLRLYFEHSDRPGTPCLLEFEGNFSAAEGYERTLSSEAERRLFQPYESPLGPDRRTIELLEAELCLRKTAQETEVLARQAYEDAQPARQKKLLAIQEEHRIHGPGCRAVYEGKARSADSQPALDYGALQFGKTYHVIRDARANRSGQLSQGSCVTFLGAETRYAEEVTLAFAGRNDIKTDLVFYPTGPQDAADCQPMLHPDQYFQVITDGLTPREYLLLDMRDVFLDLIQE